MLVLLCAYSLIGPRLLDRFERTTIGGATLPFYNESERNVGVRRVNTL